MSFFKTKAGVFLMTFLVCGLMLTLVKLRQKSKAKEQAAAAITVNGTAGGAQNAAMLQRAQETALARGDVAKKERSQVKASEGYDEAGNVTQRRATPDRIDARHSSGGTQSSAEGQAGPSVLAPSLRLRARTVDVTPTPADRPVVNAGEQAPAPKAPGKPKRFVPFGRLIKAELVMTMESTSEDQPLIGLTVEPVYNNGVLVIPAGTEIHSVGRPDRMRDRILSGTVWRMIFPREGKSVNGRQITFDGVALDREDQDGNGVTWGITDGSYGLRGLTIHNGATQKQILVFAAEALKAAGSAMQDRDQNLLGSSLRASGKNAAIAGAQGVLDSFAKQLVEELDRNGSYIRVPAGKQFYVYPRQVIDADRADVPENIAKVE